MPSWVIALIIIIIVLVVVVSIISLVSSHNKPYNDAEEKNCLVIEEVVHDTIKLKIKLWKKHDTRNQATIAIQKTYKNTIENCFLNFFIDLGENCFDLNARELNILINAIKNFVYQHKENYPFLNNLSKWIGEYNETTSSNFFSYLSMKIDRHINSKKLNNRNKIIKNHGFMPLQEFINEYRNSTDKEVLFAGIYVIWNKTKGLYYVGQAYNMHKRVATEHFSVKGECKNLLFYEDYKNGDEFFVSFIRCAREKLNEIEKKTINSYLPNVYNKTKGNI